MDNGIDFFRNASFYLNDISSKFDVNSETSGNYYPVRDSCNKDDDPEEGCLSTDALYYELSLVLPSTPYVRVAILGDSSESVVDEEYIASFREVLTPSDINCDDDDLSRCDSMCHDRGGTWDSWREECTVYRYLSNFCYRVNKVNNRWQLDVPA